jgi:hypothetical protein
MSEHGLTREDVEAIVRDPVRGVYRPVLRDRREHYGYALDGRPMNVVTNAAVTVVITVVPE